MMMTTHNPEVAQGDNTEIRRQILERFESWLDDVLATEEPPAGIASEILAQLQGDSESLLAEMEKDKGDMYSLWSALTTLTQETKLQGRAFKQLHEQIPPVDELEKSLSAIVHSHQEALAANDSLSQDIKTYLNEQQEKIKQAARQKEREENLTVLLDMRDRLVRGLEAAQEHGFKSTRPLKRNGLMRIFSKSRSDSDHLTEATEALIKGYQLTLVRLDSALEQFDVHEMACQGRPFDPQCMTAVDIEETLETPEGTVLEVYRAGYHWKGDTFRTAQVKVARRPGTGERNLNISTEVKERTNE